MDKIKPSLFLNYNRPIGKLLQDEFLKGNTYSSEIRNIVATVTRYSEILVPGVSGTQNSVLTALSNAFYIEARRKNMSLSSFGHLDPLKFIIAAMYPALMLAEVRRDLAICTHFEFGNKFNGPRLGDAVGFDGADALTNYVAYAKRYNKLVARINNLMIPETKLFTKWMYHRCRVFKDDEGDRYSYYVYNMANYYWLRTSATDLRVGHLTFEPIERGPNTTIATTLFRIETLLDEYEGDDDFVTFATEAIKAGMKHLQMEMIPSTSEEFALVPFEVEYSLDDIFSLYNAKHVMPVNIRSAKFNVADGGLAEASWDLVEYNDNLRLGHWYYGNKGLPVYNLLFFGYAAGRDIDHNPDFGTAMGKMPIFTHAKVTSEAGLTSLTKYITAYGEPTLACSRIDNDTYYSLCYGGKIIQQTFTTVPISVTASDGPIFCCSELYCFGDQMLNGATSVYYESDGTMHEILPVSLNGVDMIHDSSLSWACPSTIMNATTVVANRAIQFHFLKKNGKKNTTWSNVYIHLSGNIPESDITVKDVQDYDYVTFTTAEALDDFRHANLWNELGSL